MNKAKIFAAASVLVILLSTLGGVQFIKNCFANPNPYRNPVVTILSPYSGEEFNVPDVPFSVQVWLDGYMTYVRCINYLNYSIDGTTPIPIEVKYSSDYGSRLSTGQGLLHGLNNGTHSLLITGRTDLSTEFLFSKVTRSFPDTFNVSNPNLVSFSKSHITTHFSANNRTYSGTHFNIETFRILGH